MKSPIKVILCGLFAVVFLAGCSGGGSFEGIKLIGSASGNEQSTIGKMIRNVYMSQGTLEEVCNGQIKLIEEAGYTATEELRTEDTLMTNTYTKDNATLVLMCSKQEENAGIKVTMNLNKGE